MRITALPTYINQNEMKPRLLKECEVVIDGQNFFYNLYEESKLRFELGGEFDKYASYLKARLKMFKEAKVKCYFVFKGGDADIERKMNKVGSKNAVFDFVENNHFVMPILMKEVYKQVLEEMGIRYAICEYECKRDCVALARKLNCPVISFDIEYCFLKAPYICGTSLKYNKAERAIECNQYKLQDFLAKHSLTEEKLAIFAVLTDINIFPMNFFAKLFESLNIKNPNLCFKYIAIWRWLAKLETREALQIINSFLSDTDKQKFTDETYKIMEFMVTKNESLITDYILFPENFNFRPKDPMWFEKGVASEKIPISYINLFNCNYWIESTGIESDSSPPSQLIAADIVKYAYNLLTGYKRDEFKLVVYTNQIPIRAKKQNDKPTDTSLFQNGWANVKEMGYFERFLRESSINVDILSQIPVDAAMLIISLVYFARKKSVNVTAEVRAIIVCYVMLATSTNFPKKEKDDAIMTLKSYFSVSKGELMLIFDREVLHRFAEFQHCLKHLNYLNIMCGAAYQPTVYHKTYNGTFVNKLFQEMTRSEQDNLDNDSFINNLFSGSPSILSYINKLVDLYKVIYDHELQEI